VSKIHFSLAKASLFLSFSKAYLCCTQRIGVHHERLLAKSLTGSTGSIVQRRIPFAGDGATSFGATSARQDKPRRHDTSQTDEVATASHSALKQAATSTAHRKCAVRRRHRDVASANTACAKNKRAFFGYFLCTGKESDSLAAGE
jgi:hypothetical protein